LVGFDLAHGGAVEIEPISVVNDAIENGVAERRLADDLMPGGDRKLAGDQRGATTVAILDDFHEIAPLTGGEAIRAPVIEHEEIGFDQDAEQPGKAAIAMGEFKIGKQPRHARIMHGVTISAGFCASAHANHDLPMPQGPVTRRLRCSAIQRLVASCWNRALSSRRGVR
jgi:hypothetical protein